MEGVGPWGVCNLGGVPGGGFSLYGFDPLILLVAGRGGDAIDDVVPLHHPAVGLRLTGLDQLAFVVGDVELKAVLGGDRNGGGSCAPFGVIWGSHHLMELPAPQHCFELYIPNNKGQLITACKTEAEGRVVEGNHVVYRISAPTRDQKDEWIKSIQ